MKHQEIKKGKNATKGHCTGSSTLTCTKVCAYFATCDPPSNLNSCQSETNLKPKKGSTSGNVCCGGGTLTSSVAVSGSPCGSSTSLCEYSEETLSTK